MRRCVFFAVASCTAGVACNALAACKARQFKKVHGRCLLRCPNTRPWERRQGGGMACGRVWGSRRLEYTHEGTQEDWTPINTSASPAAA